MMRPTTETTAMTGNGYTDRFLTADETRDIVRASLDSLSLAGKRVLFLIPDGTRTMPMPQLFGLFQEMLAGKVAALDFLVALGTHRPMDDHELSRLVGNLCVVSLPGGLKQRLDLIIGKTVHETSIT